MRSLSLLWIGWWSSVLLAKSTLALPFFPFAKKKYTPLLYFRVPTMPECEAMDAAIKEMEKELGVRVERLDVLRDPAAEALLTVLTTDKTPPFLYNRESCQVLHVPFKEGRKKKDVYIDKRKIRAWAKGRLVQSSNLERPSSSAAPTVLSQKGNAMEQSELLEDMALTPEQLKGKQKMKERTKK